MSKAADSLVTMLTKLDYSKFSKDISVVLTADIHALINKIERGAWKAAETHPVRRQDGKVVHVTVPGREE